MSDEKHSDHHPPDDAAGRRSRNRRQMLLIVFLTLLPLVAAWVLFRTSSLNQHLGQSNHGTLVSPPRPLPPLALSDLDGKPLPNGAFKHHWSMIYIGGEDCDRHCVERAFKVHNIRWLFQSNYKQLRVFYLAPDRNAMIRAQRAMLGQPALLEKAGNLPVMVADSPAGKDGAQSAAAFFHQPPGSLVMVDPLGRWMAFYAPGFAVDGVYQDFRHLLRFSQLG